jgi:hypothetical protein
MPANELAGVFIRIRLQCAKSVHVVVVRVVSRSRRAEQKSMTTAAAAEWTVHRASKTTHVQGVNE